MAIYIGIFAALCSMISFLPQAWKIIRTRDTSSISASMYVLTVIGFFAWLIFGILKNEWPIIVTNGFCLAISAFILMLKLLPKKEKEQVCEALSPQ